MEGFDYKNRKSNYSEQEALAILKRYKFPMGEDQRIVQEKADELDRHCAKKKRERFSRYRRKTQLDLTDEELDFLDDIQTFGSVLICNKTHKIANRMIELGLGKEVDGFRDDEKSIAKTRKL